MTLSERLSKIKRKAQKQITTDNIVDVSVDFLILVFDVLSSPILIVMRLVGFFIRKYVVERIKDLLSGFSTRSVVLIIRHLDWND